jgi:hypothetical protein
MVIRSWIRFEAVALQRSRAFSAQLNSQVAPMRALARQGMISGAENQI